MAGANNAAIKASLRSAGKPATMEAAQAVRAKMDKTGRSVAEVVSSKGGNVAAKKVGGAPGVAGYLFDGKRKYMIGDGSGKLYRSEGSARRAANKVAAKGKKAEVAKKVAKARKNAPVATIKTARGERYQAPGSFKLYKNRDAAQKASGAKVAKAVKQSSKQKTKPKKAADAA